MVRGWEALPSGAREIPAATWDRATDLAVWLLVRPQLSGAPTQQPLGWSCFPAAGRCWIRRWTAAP